MATTFDQAKRDRTIRDKGLDFADADIVFAGDTLEIEDDRRVYVEVRIITIGHLRGRMVEVVWTQRGGDRHIISMRKSNEREQQRYR